MQRKLTICLGPICSGKTKWSKIHVRNNENTYRFCFDEYLYMCTGSGIYDDKIASSVPSLIGNLLLRANIVIDGYPLDYERLRQTVNYRLQSGAEVCIRLMDVKFDEAVRRNINRARTTGRVVDVKEMRKYMVMYKEFISSDNFQRLIDISKAEVIAEDFVDANMSFIM